MQSFSEVIRDYAAGKKWYWYVPLWLFFVYILYEIYLFAPNEPVGTVIVPMSMLYFGLHELAHAFTMAFPAVITAAAGSLSEILFGVLLVYALVRSKAFFAALYACLWLAFAFKDAGIYMADARAQNLTLFSPFGDNAIHDWQFVFFRLGLLPYDTKIGGAFIITGYLIAIAALGFGLRLMYLFAKSQDELNQTQHAKVLAEKLKASRGYESVEALTPKKVPLVPHDRSTPKQPVVSIYPEATRGRLADEVESNPNVKGSEL
jgi:hypothetical protein